MSTCFLFSHGLDEKHCLSLRLDQHGEIDAALMPRSFEEIKALQLNAKTMVVIPTDRCSLYEVELPWLSDRKARAAIPYALEDQLAQSVADLHFSFDRSHYQNGRYLVVVMAKSLLSGILSQFETLKLRVDRVTVDWFALNNNEACATEHSLLVNDSIFKGALRGELAALYQKKPEVGAELFLFKDSLPTLRKKGVAFLDESCHTWIAKRLSLANSMNLCQGELQVDSHNRVNRWYYATALLATLLVVNGLFLNALSLHALHSKIADVDKKIAVIYREFFPQAVQVISPKFRITQWLQGDTAGREASAFWILLEKFGGAFQSNQITLQQLRFQQSMLSVTVVSKNFAALEELQQRLQKAGVKVTQTQATSHDKDVAATLELSMSTAKGTPS